MAMQCDDEDVHGSFSPFHAKKPGLEHAHKSPRARRAQLRHQNNAATMMQAQVRMRIQRNEFHQYLAGQDEEAAAVRIQAIHRGKVVRETMEAQLEDEITEMAATNIQVCQLIFTPATSSSAVTVDIHRLIYPPTAHSSACCRRHFAGTRNVGNCTPGWN